MSARFLLGLDFGGGCARCLAVDVDGGEITVATRSWSFPNRANDPTAFDIDLDRSWRLLGEATREAIARAGARPDQIIGIAATGMRHASVVLDASGDALMAAPNRDARGLMSILGLADRAEGFFRRTGHWPNPVQPAGRLLWMAAEEPDAFARADVHLSVSDWIGWRLSGERAAEPSQACETLLFDLERRDWDWEGIDSLSLPRSLFPPVRDAGEQLGPLRDEPARELGLPPGIPVAVGGGDTQSGLIGAGVTAPGQLGAIVGTTAPIQRVFDRPIVDDQARLWSVHHAVPGLFALESNAGGTGEALEWLAGALYGGTSHPVLHLLDEASRSVPGAAGVLSNLGAEVMNARQLAPPIGNLTLCHLGSARDPDRRRHLARAIVEGMVFALRANAEQIEQVSAEGPTALHLGGGVSRSALVAQLASDIFGQPVEVARTPETSALGAAICAGVGAGVFDDLAAGAARLAKPCTHFAPDPGSSARYGELYESWNALRQARSEGDVATTGWVMRGLFEGASPADVAPADAFRPKILVSADLDEAGLEALRAIGDVEYASFRTAMRLLTGPSLVEALEGVHVFVTEIDVVDAASLAQARDLRVLAVCRGDAVNIDLGAATALGIPAIHTPGRNADAVADLSVAYLLMLARKLPEANAFLREPGGQQGDMGRMGRAFGTLQGRELWRKHVGLIGLGAVGRKVLERLAPFGVCCLVHDPFLSDDAVRLLGAEPVDLARLLAESDFVSLHAPVTDTTRGMIGAAELAAMKPGACLVNSARAALVDETALLEALTSGRLGGAALDVFAIEPPGSDHPLLALPNVIATPHIGGNTVDVAAHQGRIVADELLRMRRGERPRHLLDPAAWPGFSWSEPRPAPSPELVAKLGKGPGPAVTDLQRDADAGERAPRSERPTRTANADASAPSAPAAGRVSDPALNAEIRRAMEGLLRTFVERVPGDAKLGDFARTGQEVTLHFILADLPGELHLGFAGGGVHAGLGAPEDPSGASVVELRMSTDLFDGMLTGRLNAMQAAMNGDLSFSGDTARAMTLTHVQSDLERIYSGARDELGDPGDLSCLGAPAALPAATSPGGSGGSGSDETRRQLIEVVNELYAAQLITATGGNVSTRIPEAPDQAWITPSQLFKGDLCEEILVRIDARGRALDSGARSPSSEALMHTAVLAAKPEAQAVIHCHAPNATILVNTGLPFLPISTEAAFFVNIGRIPFVMPGTQELADRIVEAMGDGWAVLMQNHGLLVAGRTLRRAADMAEIIERSAEVIIGCYAVGREPPVLPAEAVETLSKYGDLMA